MQCATYISPQTQNELVEVMGKHMILQGILNDLNAALCYTMELKRRKSRYTSMPSDLRPVSPATAIKDCDPATFPNISVLLQIACTLPVTSCECERSASALRQLNNYMRASMGKSRLSNLALLHIHYDVPSGP